MSVILRGQEDCKDSWIPWRTVHIIGYHREEKSVESLFQHHMENTLEGKENYLYALHLGNISVELLPGWPMPHHQDEPALPLNFNPPEFEHRKSLLDVLYSKQFKKEKNKVIWKDFFLEWDTLASEDSPGSTRREIMQIWPDGKGKSTIEYPKENNGFVPFTILKFGPFTKKGTVLIHYRTKLQEDSYEEIIGKENGWGIYGPEGMLLEIKRKYLSQINTTWEKLAREHLEKFTDFLSFWGCYDHIIINSNSVDRVKSIRGNGIVKAPMQPPEDFPATRFISAYPRFTLACSYINGKIKKWQN